MLLSGIACFAVVGHFVDPDLTSPMMSLTLTPLLGYLAIVGACVAMLLAFLRVENTIRMVSVLGKDFLWAIRLSHGLHIRRTQSGSSKPSNGCRVCLFGAYDRCRRPLIFDSGETFSRAETTVHTRPIQTGLRNF
jgi:hypothetical protein